MQTKYSYSEISSLNLHDFLNINKIDEDDENDEDENDEDSENNKDDKNEQENINASADWTCTKFIKF